MLVDAHINASLILKYFYMLILKYASTIQLPNLGL